MFELPNKVCYNDTVIGAQWDFQRDILFLDQPCFNLWAATEGEEAKKDLLRQWFLPMLGQRATK